MVSCFAMPSCPSSFAHVPRPVWCPPGLFASGPVLVMRSLNDFLLI
jgi:hypothetical protein